MARDRIKLGLGWSPRNFRFDEIDPDSACIPYGEADIRLPAGVWGKTIRVEGRLVAANMPYQPRWRPSGAVLTFERYWRRFLHRIRLADWWGRIEKRLAEWPAISSPPALEVLVDGSPIVRYTPSQTAFTVEAVFPPRPDGLNSFSLGVCLKQVTAAEVLGALAKLLLAVPMPLALWRRMRDWQFRVLQQRRLRLVAVYVDGELIVDFRQRRAAPGAIVGKKAIPGINVIAHFSSEDGIAEAARGSVRAADAIGLPACLVELKIPSVSRQNDEAMKGRASDRMIYPVSLYHSTQNEVGDILQYQGADWMAGRYNIAYWLWETNEFPERWIPFTRQFDEIWTSSQFATNAIQMSVPIPVLTMPPVIEFAPPAGTDFRVKFGLPERMFLFLFVFDLNSLAARKNPGAVVEAYRRVAARNRSVGLVLKTHNAANHMSDMEGLRQQIDGLPNVFIIDRTLERHEVYELMACCDAFVSLHHAEGFGLCLAEAMYLGKPCVSTDWSATAEFVTARNGFPVQYRLTPLMQTISDYTKGSVWADPDVEHAAACMQSLVGDPGLCAALGAQGAKDIRERFSSAAIGRRYARRLELTQFW